MFYRQGMLLLRSVPINSIFSFARFGVLLDLWTNEAHYQERKRKLLECYFEAYQHVICTGDGHTSTSILSSNDNLMNCLPVCVCPKVLIQGPTGICGGVGLATQEDAYQRYLVLPGLGIHQLFIYRLGTR